MSLGGDLVRLEGIASGLILAIQPSCGIENPLSCGLKTYGSISLHLIGPFPFQLTALLVFLLASAWQPIPAIAVELSRHPALSAFS